MALSAYCPSCRRTVYVEEGDTPVCPVCTSPLLEAVDVPDDKDQIEGTK
jgi:hypothetical protein